MPTIFWLDKNRPHDAQIIKIPILIDDTYKTSQRQENAENSFILHTGSLSETKDGVIAMFEAYAKAYKLLGGSLKFVLTQKQMQQRFNPVSGILPNVIILLVLFHC